MRFSQFIVFVKLIQYRSTFLQTFHIQRFTVLCIWLTTAADTSTWTRHDLNEVISVWLLTNYIKKLSCISKTMRYCNANLNTVDIDSTFFNAIKTSDWCNVKILELFTCHQLISSSDGSFHHTAGRTKDSSCTC